MLLSDYISQVQALLNDPLSQFYSTTNLTTWINRGRSEVAKRSACIRRLTPSSASLVSVSVLTGGSGYTSATVTITGPDAIGGTYTQAVAAASILGGQVSSITVTVPGTGYVVPPTVTITGNGTGATAVAILGPHWTTQTGVEVYQFADATAVLQSFESGLQAVIGVMDMAVSWGSMKPTLQWCPWASFQAYARAINQGQQYPALWAQFQMGETGSAYVFPIPSGVYEMQWDCFCTPAALGQTQTVDLIPDNWTNAVIYYACYLAYLNAQRKDDSQDMFARYERSVIEAAAYSSPPRTPTYYYGDD
jgi:hypothetical protein